MRNVDVVIVGGGAGGLQVAHDLERHGRSYVLLERTSSVGSFFAKFPRHRTLISVNKVHTGYDDEDQQMRFDWNSLLDDADGDHCLFKHFSDDYFPPADAMVRYLEAFAARFVSSIERECTVRRIAKVDGAFYVEADGERSFRSKAVVMATGVSKAYRPPIPGLELAELYTTFDTAPHRFENKRVLIIGKGNSAFETADAMMHKAAVIHLASPSSIRFAWNSHFPGHLRAVNNNFLDTYQLKIQNALLDANVRRLQAEPDGRIRASFEYVHEGECEDIIYDHVICCAGFAMDVDLFDPSACPAMTIDGRFPALNSQFESATVPGLFFAGTLTQSLDYKRSNSAFVHGFRYNARALVRLSSSASGERRSRSRPDRRTPSG